ncbi:hypothetical protein E3N88_00305 [Mikania micrantha]|uniref:Uncharacterized protein n=1 Tax=Mikania micrantha TaxID=192012 RepID=A0A5N6PXQ8_9ASTR|nr:hypothetical protein E3N88_00305 [Mikania micrantha]
MWAVYVFWAEVNLGLNPGMAKFGLSNELDHVAGVGVIGMFVGPVMLMLGPSKVDIVVQKSNEHHEKQVSVVQRVPYWPRVREQEGATQVRLRARQGRSRVRSSEEAAKVREYPMQGSGDPMVRPS